MRFYTSDLHFGHKNIIEYTGRPYFSVEHMNEHLIENWNKAVTPDDQVYVLGDVAMGKIAESLPLVSELNGTKHLIAGNHDRCWAGAKNYEKWIDRYREVGFETITSELTPISVHGVEFLMYHFPPVGDSGNVDRYQSWRPQVSEDQFLMHGHTHEFGQINGRWVHVGTDAWSYTPVSEDQIYELIEPLL